MFDKSEDIPAIKLLKFSYKKLSENRQFTESQAIGATRITATEFKSLKGLFLNEFPAGSGNFGLTKDGLFKYLNYSAMTSSKRHAFWAQCIAIIALVVSGVSLMAPFESTGDSISNPVYSNVVNSEIPTSPKKAVVEIDPAQIGVLEKQLEELKTAIKCIGYEQSAQPVEGDSEC